MTNEEREQARQARKLLHDAVRDLWDQVGAHSVKNFLLMAEGPMDEIEKLDKQLEASCATCKGRGEVLYMYPRPGGPPGNQMISCPDC